MLLKNIVRSPLQIHYLLRLLVFWLVFFTAFRFIFIGFHTLTSFHTESLPAAHSLVSGFRLDLSTIAYLIVPSFLLWVIYQFRNNKVFAFLNSLYHILVLFSISLLCVGNVKMYPIWESLLSYKVLEYVKYPKEVMAFIPYTELFLWVGFLLLYYAFALFLFKKIVINFKVSTGNKLMKALVILLTPGILAISARGGFQLAPINESSAYFSPTPFYNHVAVNPFWYFMHSYLETDSNKNPYLFMDPSLAEERNKNLFQPGQVPGDTILTTLKPNIVLILLESWTADIIESLGGETSVTPFFDSLRKEGLLFTQVYSVGWRTEHGLVSILSGYPMPPHQSIITAPYKAEKLPNINDVFVSDGYSSSFYYGGEVGFANMKSFLINAHINTIIDKSSFDTKQLNSKWGAHDQYVFEKQLHDLKTTPEPFFSVLLTLSSHEPFDVPMETPFKGKKDPDLFRKAVYYTDHCLGDYFRAAKKEKWFSNTLFILVADHGSRLPKRSNLNMPQSKKIPLLFVGDALKQSVRGTTVDKIANQNDLAATLLNQLHHSYSAFSRSKDILSSSSKAFAYYTNDNVLGWITPEQSFIYFYTSHKLQVTSNSSSHAVVRDSLFLDAKAYLQTHYQQYLDY